MDKVSIEKLAQFLVTELKRGRFKYNYDPFGVGPQNIVRHVSRDVRIRWSGSTQATDSSTCNVLISFGHSEKSEEAPQVELRLTQPRDTAAINMLWNPLHNEVQRQITEQREDRASKIYEILRQVECAAAEDVAPETVSSEEQA